MKEKTFNLDSEKDVDRVWKILYKVFKDEGLYADDILNIAARIVLAECRYKDNSYKAVMDVIRYLSERISKQSYPIEKEE
jgi:hypothetical protein